MVRYIVLPRGHCIPQIIDFDKYEMFLDKVNFKDGSYLSIDGLLEYPIKFVNSTATDLFANVFLDIEKKDAKRSSTSLPTLENNYDKIRSMITVSKVKGEREEENLYEIKENEEFETQLQKQNEIIVNDIIASYVMILKPIKKHQKDTIEKEKRLGQFNAEYILRPNIPNENTIEVPKRVDKDQIVLFSISGVLIRDGDNRIVRVDEANASYYEMEGSQESVEFLNLKHTFQNGNQIDTQFIIDHTDQCNDVFRENIRYRNNHMTSINPYDFLYGYIVELSTVSTSVSKPNTQEE